MLRRILLVVVMSFAAITGALAQGAIAGVIKDAVTGEAVIGANVIVQGTRFGAATDIEGKFLISNVPVGTYNLQVSFVTYNPHSVPNVVVENGKRTTIDIPLSENVSELQEVVVTGTRQVNTDMDLVKTIKEAKLVVVGISAEQIGRSLDRDAAQVLRRVPGITIKGDQFVQIRGLSERYNVVMLHNAYAPSVETDIRSFSFATLPSNQLDRMLVFKSPSADLPGDFGGGVVKVYTKNIPDENSLVVDYSTQIRLGTTFRDFYGQQHNNFQATGFNDHYYNLPSGFPANLNDVRGDNLVAAGQSLKNLWAPQKRTAIPDQRVNITFNRKFNIGGVQIGNISAITYSNAFSRYSVLRTEQTWSEDTKTASQILHYNDQQYNQNIRAGFLFNWAFKFDENNKVEFKNLYNQSSADQFVNRDAPLVDIGLPQRNGAFDKIYRGIYSGQLLGTHDFFDKRTTVEWLAGYNKSYRDEPDYKRYRTDYDDFSNTSQVYLSGVVSPFYLGRYYGHVNESSKTGGFSIKQQIGNASDPLKNIEVKAGVFYERKDRDFTQRNLGFVTASLQFDPNLRNLSVPELFAAQNINNTTGVAVAEQSQKRDNYVASNNLLAYYGKFTLPLNKFTIDAGVRIEDNHQKLDGYDLNGDFTPADLKVTRVLPSANVSYNIKENMLVRAAYGETLNRPEFRELAYAPFFDFNLSYLFQGFPQLKTAKIQNIDLRWELYPSKGELITAGVFYKKFTNPIEAVVDFSTGGTAIKNANFKNAANATSYGAEIEIKKSLNELTGSRVIDDISVVFNATVIKSKVELAAADTQGQEANRPLQGQAPYVINTGLYYDNTESGWQVNLLYNVVGRNVLYAGNMNYASVYVMPRNVVDLIFSKGFGEHFILKGGVSDILNQPVLWMQDVNHDKKFDRNFDTKLQSYKPGQVFSLGFSYTFN